MHNSSTSRGGRSIRLSIKLLGSMALIPGGNMMPDRDMAPALVCLLSSVFCHRRPKTTTALSPVIGYRVPRLVLVRREGGWLSDDLQDPQSNTNGDCESIGGAGALPLLYTVWTRSGYCEPLGGFPQKICCLRSLGLLLVLACPTVFELD